MENLNLFLEMDVSPQALVPHKRAVIALAADRLAEKVGMSYEHAKSALAARERLGSTGLGHGVAMPHAVAANCPRPACALLGLSRPVDFDAPDDIDVDVVFAVIWPQDEVREFTRLLACASRVLREPAMLRLIRKSADGDVIRQAMHLSAQVRGSLATAATHTVPLHAYPQPPHHPADLETASG